MKDLVLSSYMAQSRYVEARIHDKKKQQDFNLAYKTIYVNFRNNVDPTFCLFPSEGRNMALDMFLETEKNLRARFVTGVPLESSNNEY
jgi:hypothetical protein